MLSRLLLHVASTRFWHILALYVATLLVVMGLGSFLVAAPRDPETDVRRPPRSVRSLFVESAANTLGFSSIDATRQDGWSAFIVLAQGFIGLLINGVFVALVVYRAIRINHGALLFADHALLSRKDDGKWRLEIRICNASKYDITNVVIKVQMVEQLDTFPASTQHKASKVILNYEEYLYLNGFNYLLVSSSQDAMHQDGINTRIAKVDESFFLSRFSLRVLVQGQYIKSGLNFTQLRIYKDDEVHKGRWRYYLKSDLLKKGRILEQNFNAFEAERPAVEAQESEPAPLTLGLTPDASRRRGSGSSRTPRG